MTQVYKITKGLNIRISGKAEKLYGKAGIADLHALKPSDFHGLIAKLEVKEGDNVKAGTVLFTDKNRPAVRFTSPVSGKVVSVNRGERRVIREVIIQSDHAQASESFAMGSPLQMSREQVTEMLLISGAWPSIRQRPYHVVANPEKPPKSIFISCFDTAPLAPDYDFVIMGNESDFQVGLEALTRLTDGKVHVNISDEYPASTAFAQARHVQVNRFRGPHPAGNVGVQIQRIDPVNKGEVVWFVAPQDVVIIGRLFSKGVYDTTRTVALTGSEVTNPRYYKIKGGAAIRSLTEGNLKGTGIRYISGNPLTGTRIEPGGFLGYYDSQLTAIPEGDEYEFFGWALPGFGKYSYSRSFFSWLMPGREYRLNTNLHGGNRAFVVTGLYEKVFPFDIYPMQLLKAMLAEDVDQMERLGIYEVAEEDFALCEFICPSKTDMQSIVRKGLDLVRHEMS